MREARKIGAQEKGTNRMDDRDVIAESVEDIEGEQRKKVTYSTRSTDKQGQKGEHRENIAQKKRIIPNVAKFCTLRTHNQFA